MKLDAEQRKVLNQIKTIARQRGVSQKELKAAIETGIVESGLRNLSGGDADSAGWRQERASLYKNPTNLTASINRFFDETAKVRNKYGSAGELAAAVQRPAAQYRGRYHQNSAAADRLMGGYLGGTPAAPTAPKSNVELVPGTPATTTVDKKGALVGALLGRKFGQKGSLLADYQSAIASGAYTSTTPGTPASVKTVPAPGAPATTRGSYGVKTDSLKPGGNFKGTEDPIIALAQLAHAEGLKTTSAKRNNTNPASGSRSDHDHGNTDATARDLSNGSAPTPQMDEAAVKIARALGNKTYKKGQRLEMVTTINGIRYQVIYRSNLGGNHFNHIHVGAKRIG